MSDNPFFDELGKIGRKSGRVTREMLFEIAEDYNKFRWVIDSGKPYFVAERKGKDGVPESYLARNA